MDKFEITIDARKNGSAILKRGDTKIASIYVIYDKVQIEACDLSTEARYRRKGYGTMLMYALMGVAKAKRKPIILWSINEAVGYYQKLGFIRLRRYQNGWYKGKRVIIDNLNPHKTFTEQVKHNQFIWIPPNMHIVHIYI